MLLNNSDKCDIITSSFLEDLQPYIIENNNIKWLDNSSTTRVPNAKINLFVNPDPTPSNNGWVPNFITNDNNIDNKIISNYGSILGDSLFDSGRIGIEDMFTFVPRLKSWNITNAVMSIDWILNRANVPYCVVAGLSHWTKNNTAVVTGTIDSFPIYSRLKHNDIIYVKIDDFKLRRISRNATQQNIISSTSISFNYTAEADIEASSLGNNAIYTLYNSDSIKLWIPDGDQILYYLNKSDQTNRLDNNIGPQSYISGSLYKYYNIIYNSLTSEEPILPTSTSRSIKRLRLYKKLAHALSTSPFVSDFFVAFLSKPPQNITSAINTYLNTNSTNIDTDINNLFNVLMVISNEYSKYEILNQNNIVQNNTELFTKFMNKYGAKLKLTNDSTVSYNKNLAHGDSVVIEEIGDRLVNKTTNNTTIVANKTIRLNKLSIETKLSDTESSIDLKVNNNVKNIIFLYDTVKPDILDTSNLNISLYRNTNVRLKGDLIPDHQDYDPLINIFYYSLGLLSEDIDKLKANSPILKITNLSLLQKYIDNRFPMKDENFINSQFSFVWEKVSGPSMKLIDFDKNNANSKFEKAYGSEIVAAPSSTGRYVIKCTVSGPFGSFTKLKTIFVVDGREKIGDEVNSNFGTYINFKDRDQEKVASFARNSGSIRETPNLGSLGVENANIGLNKDKLKIFTAGLDSIAIHRNGLFVPIRSNYIVEQITSNNRNIERLSNNYKFLFDPDAEITPITRNSTLSINYVNNNTIIKLDRIILRNVRSNHSECSQCYSLYDPKFKSFIRQTDKRPTFTRSNKFPDGYALQKYSLNNNTYVRSNIITYSYPNISLDFAPPIKTYGGYGNKVLNNLTIKQIEGLARPPAIDINSGLVANTPISLSSVTGYKLDYQSDYDTFDNNIRGHKFCYEKQLMPRGYINFKKGTFVPDSGWVVGDNRNLSSVLKFNPGARESFNFLGPGILGLSNYSPSRDIESNDFTSSIRLTMNSKIRWDPGAPIEGENCLPDNDEARRNIITTARGDHLFKSQLIQELADQLFQGTAENSKYYHHGYRILGAGDPKRPETNVSTTKLPVNDEFDLEIQDSNILSYAFTKVGYPIPINSISAETRNFINLYLGQNISPGSEGDGRIVRDYIENNESLGLVNARVNELSIKDIEIKLNFLNYVNTKNLSIWLEVNFCSNETEKINSQFNNDEETVPKQITSENRFVDQFIPADTYKDLSIDGGRSIEYFSSNNINIRNSDVNTFLQKLTDFNSFDDPGKLKIHLLNQEIIQNKEYNFSVKFSDTANKNNVLFDHNLFTFGKINSSQTIVQNNQEVRPTTNINNINTKQNCYYNYIINTNNLNINNNTFHKFSNKALFKGIHPPAKCVPAFGPYDGETIFTLHIEVLEEPDDMNPLDTLINNELYSNISAVDNKLTSANLFNNLCSWELILHTEETKKPTTSIVNSLANYGGTDSLGLIKYGAPPIYPGYSFIADLSDKKFLLPLVNINAPSMFFQNYNACEYADSELIGKGVLINTPRFPTEAIVLILAGTAVGGMSGSLVGVLVGGLGPTYYAGFQLLYDYFREARLVPVLENAQRETFDLNYDSYPMGNSDKILLNVSKDGLFWYKLEASIFKLSNTPALPLKKFNFEKTDNKLFKFNFSIISQNSDIIDDIFIPYIVNQATPENADEDTQEQYKNINNNNIYNNFNFLNNKELISFNKFFHSLNIFDSKAQGHNLFIIDHAIPYHVINIGDTVKTNCLDTDGLPLSRSVEIKSKALVYKDGQYKTILSTDSSIAGCSELYLPDDVVVIYNNASTIDNFIEEPVSLFGLSNDQPPYSSIPEVNFSTNSLGSYGDGSIVKDKNILSSKIKLNNIESIYNILNNFNNDKFYSSQFSMITGISPNGAPNKFNSKFQAYPIYYDTSIDSLVDHDTFYISSNNNDIESINNLLEHINTSTKDYKTYYKDKKYNMMYLKIDNDIIKNYNRSTKGFITIENNYTYNESIERISQEDLTLLVNRLNILNVTKNTSLDAILGNSRDTSQILSSNSIFYIQNHYDLLDADPTNCGDNPLPAAGCNKTRCYDRLQKLYYERSQILKLIENQAIKKASIIEREGSSPILGEIEYDNNENIKLLNNTTIFNKNSIFSLNYSYILNPEKQIYHSNNGGILADKRVNIITNNNDSSILIEYIDNINNLYWINIDPKQSCSIAEELRPKILKSIKYTCRPTNVVQDVFDYNNICPDSSSLRNFDTSSVDFDIQTTPSGTTYTIKQSIVDAKKRELEDKGCNYGWKEHEISRKFRIHSDKNIKNLLPNAEFLVDTTETYEIAKTALENAREQNYVTSTLINDGFIKNDYSGDPYGKLQGIAGGIGEPTRVYNVFNLDDTSNLKVQIRKAPRMLRGIDALFTVLRYGEKNTYQPQTRPPLDPLDTFGVERLQSLINDFYQWECYEAHPASKIVRKANLPDIFKLFNEMTFRSFFGSTDKIENKTEQLKSGFQFELIPFEYFNNPEPPASS